MPKRTKPASIDDQNGPDVTPEPEEKTGAGSEASEGMQGEPRGASQEHRSAYGGEGGKPKLPNG